MRLSVLDQSPIISGHDARRAIEETLALARRADELGYYRYWLAEHHAIAALADPCPEVLVARLGAETQRMRIGTGGVLLPYYSAFRVAEAFRMLEALYPGRIDLGIGRAPGGDARTAQAVARRRLSRRRAHFPQQVLELSGHLDGTLPATSLQAACACSPRCRRAPEVWLLGSSDYSGALAAQLGLPFSFAHFINPRGGDEVTRAYREHFRPGREKAPRSDGLHVPDLRRDRRRGRAPRGADRPAAPAHGAQHRLADARPMPRRRAHRYGGEERRYVMGQRARAVIGGPRTCRDELEEMAQRYAADEVMVLTITGDYETRRRSYELLDGRVPVA